MAFPLGNIFSEDKIYSTRTIQTQLPLVTDATANLGIFSTGSGKHQLFVSVKNLTSNTVKQYSLSLNHNHTGDLWFKAEPLGTGIGGEVDNAYQLEVNADGVYAALRLKRLLGGSLLDFQIVLQNVGREDAYFTPELTTGQDDTPIVGNISSLPHGYEQSDHNQLANRGYYTHENIDSHIDALSPHTEHENINNKGIADGYAPLDARGKLPTAHIAYGNSADTVTEGNDPRLSDDRYPTDHATSHGEGGTDPIHINNLAGIANQAKTHGSSDTDLGINSIHHTLGQAPFQAAPGNHDHDTRYAPIAKGVTGGNSHEHDGQGTTQVNHNNLINKGINTHNEIDDHISADSPHIGHELIANRGVAQGYPTLDSNAKIQSYFHRFGSSAGDVCEGNDARLSNAREPLGHTSSHSYNGSDPINIAELSGTTTQAKTHDSADTDSSSTAIHHTLGSSATQAAPGNHNHTGTYAPVSDGVTNGNAHAHTSSGDGGSISHTDLSNKGEYTHVQIDSHIGAANPHSGHEVTSNKGAANGYAGLDNNSKIKAENTNFGNSQGTVCEGNDSRLTNARTPTSHTHGGITNTGKLGTEAGKPVITGTGGLMTAGEFGDDAGTFCAGDDPRLEPIKTLTITLNGGSTIGVDMFVFDGTEDVVINIATT